MISELTLWRRLEGLDVILPAERNPDKDTLDFLVIVNSKTEFIFRAFQLHPQCARLTWVDFGVAKVFSEPRQIVNKLIACDFAPPGFTAPGCWDAPIRATDFVSWRYAGGFFTLDAASAAAFHVANRQVIDNLLPKLTWEVNVWTWMECEQILGGTNGIRLNWYAANHDDSLLDFASSESWNLALKSNTKIEPIAMRQRPRLCLNMIVRNESAIIKRALKSIVGVVSSCVICDTGSTDETQDLILSFCYEHGILCELHTFPFVDFSQARNQALDLARQSALEFEYLLLFDADMELVVDDPSALDRLHADAALLVQENTTISYRNVRLLRRKAAGRYVGATHEALSVNGEIADLDGLRFIDHADGSSRPEKLDRDERMLRAALAEHAADARSMFYLAQTLRDAHRYQEAIEWYSKRCGVGGWAEECWYSQYQKAVCLLELGETTAFVSACLDAYAMRPTRAEPLIFLARFYTNTGKHDASLLLLEQAALIPWPQNDRLFVERDAYGDVYRELTSISGFYSVYPERRRRGHDTCEALAVDSQTTPQRRYTARSNLFYYAMPLHEICPGAITRKIDIKLPHPFVATNPSFVLDGDCYRGIVRGVNYDLSNGRYTVHDDDGVIRTSNFLVRIDGQSQIVDVHQMLDLSKLKRATQAGICGFEDCRLFHWQGGWWCSATARDLAQDARATIVLLKLNQDGDFENAFPMMGFGDDQHQKNWMPIAGDRLRYVYSCGPAIVLDASAADGSFVVESSRDPGPALDHWRGGSQLIPWRDGFLAVVHEAHNTDQGRQYLHRFVAFDSTHEPVAASNGFFINNLGVEFVAGLTPGLDGCTVLVSFGSKDCEAWTALIPVDEVQALLHPFSSGKQQ